MGSINLFLSRQANGQYMLTDKLPDRCEIDGTGRDDYYVAKGDRVGQRHFCPLLAGVAEVKLKRLESVPVRVTIERI